MYYAFSGLWHDLPPFATFSKQEIVKRYEYDQRWVQIVALTMWQLSINLRMLFKKSWVVIKWYVLIVVQLFSSVLYKRKCVKLWVLYTHYLFVSGVSQNCTAKRTPYFGEQVSWKLCIPNNFRFFRYNKIDSIVYTFYLLLCHSS